MQFLFRYSFRFLNCLRLPHLGSTSALPPHAQLKWRCRFLQSGQLSGLLGWIKTQHLAPFCCGAQRIADLTLSLSRRRYASTGVDELIRRRAGASIKDYIRVLQECTRARALAEGRRLHAHIVSSGLESNENLGRNLVRLYSRCGSMAEARQMFDRTFSKNVFLWTEVLKGYVDNGQGEKALTLFHQLRGNDMKPDKFVYAIIVNVCGSLADLSEGRRIHARMVEDRVEADLLLSNSLISFYMNCGSTDDALHVFEGMPQRDVISWNTIISGLNEHGLSSKALMSFKRMLEEGLHPNVVTLICTANACASIQALEEGRIVHSLATSLGLGHDILLNNAIVDMYAKCRSLQDARTVFDSMRTRDTVSWNAIIQGYAQHGLVDEAFDLLKQMQCCSGKPDEITFIHLLKACTLAASLEQSKCLHDFVLKSGLESNVFISNSLIHLYGKCGSLHDARKVFDRMTNPNVVSWTTMITAYAQAGFGEEALSVYEQMEQEMDPNAVTFVSALKACALVGALDKGKDIHERIRERAVVLDVVIETALIHMYGKCGSIDDARSVFKQMSSRNVVSWNAMIACCAQNGNEEGSLELFQQMQEEGVEPDTVTYISVLNACSGTGALTVGRFVHSCIISHGYEIDCIIGNALIDMYAKCQSPECARQVFDSMLVRDVISWNSLFKGYIQHGRAEEALKLLRNMQQESVKPDVVTYVTLLNGCSSIEALIEGREIHRLVTNAGLDCELIIGNALIDMYAKCGSIEDGREVFYAMSEKDMVSWSSMVAGYAQHGLSTESLDLFETMLEKGVPTDSISFLGVLSACSRVGFVERGLDYFSSMIREHGIKPSDAHYACLVDLLGRAGRLHEAANLIRISAGQTSVSVWISLLACCRLHGDHVLAKEAAGHILELEPENSAAFVLLANTYAAAGRWHDKTRTWQLMKGSGVRKDPGRSWINVDNEVHAFMVEDQTHLLMNEIYAETRRLSLQLN